MSISHASDQITRIRDLIEQHDIRFIRLQFSDIVGISKQVTIPIQHWESALDHGVWFDGSSIEGYARIAESDMYLIPDLTTFVLIPWESDLATARVICDVQTVGGEPFPGDPRYVLRQQTERAAEQGLTYNVGAELEFFLFQPHADGALLPLRPHDRAGYFDVSTDLSRSVRRKMVDALQEQGIQINATHHEGATGQSEIDLQFDNALATADKIMVARETLKAVAQQNGLHCTFMPKPIAGVNGSGMHVHQSLADLDSGETAMYDGDDEYGLSQRARHFVAGQLAHARAITALLAPLVNSYKRFVPGHEAPVYLSWGRTNRGALIRIPRVNPALYGSTRCELRCPDASANPYLAFAVMLAAGLDGISAGLDPGAPVEEDLFRVDSARLGLERLPTSLGDALAALQRDEIIQAALGQHVYERYVEAKSQEWDEYQLYVTQWELERYLRVF